VRPGPGDFVAVCANDNAGMDAAPVTGVAGLVLAFESDSAGAAIVAIRAMDAEGHLAEPIHVAREADDIIALWRGLGRELNLPLFLRDIRGVMTAMASLLPERAFARRRGSPLSGRRPRFLARRMVPLAPHRAPEGPFAAEI
jgi:hypothetical protein